MRNYEYKRDFIVNYILLNDLLSIKNRPLHKEDFKDTTDETILEVSTFIIENIDLGYSMLDSNKYRSIKKDNIINNIYNFIQENNIDINNNEHLCLIDMNFKNNEKQEFLIKP